MKSSFGTEFEPPIIRPELYRQLIKVEPSIAEGIEYRPCRVTLKDGISNDFVYVVEAAPYIKYWGVWPTEDRAKHALDLRDVSEIQDSPFRLPAKLATTLYKQGESGMGYTIFTLILKDGSRLACATGNAVDFPTQDVRTYEIVDVIPHEGRREVEEHSHDPRWRPPAYAWCLYRRP